MSATDEAGLDALVDLGGAFAGIKASRRLTAYRLSDVSSSPSPSPRAAAAAAATAEPAAATAEPAAAAISLVDFLVLKVLGRGSFGKVCLVRRKDTRKLYALKALNKEALLRRNQIAHTQTERNILQHVVHPFLVQLQFAFQSDTRLYLGLEFMPGGELFYWLNRSKKFDVARAKLYAAEVLLALEFLHAKDIIYRDLKPENILVDKDGHLKLTDFGLSKEAVKGVGAENGTTTFCGTPEYLAPEILQSVGHGKGVDWWSLGVLLCEMLTGDPPFYHANVQKMYRNILRGKLELSPDLTPDARSLLKALLKRNVAKRLGSSERGAAAIKEHLFFMNLGTAPLDWDKVLAKAYTPSFVPPTSRLGSVTELNFDESFTSKTTKESVVAQMTPQQIEDGRFEGFTYEAEEHDSAALAALRRNSSSSEAWDELSKHTGGLKFVLQKVTEEADEEDDDSE